MSPTKTERKKTNMLLYHSNSKLLLVDVYCKRAKRFVSLAIVLLVTTVKTMVTNEKKRIA